MTVNGDQTHGTVKGCCEGLIGLPLLGIRDLQDLRPHALQVAALRHLVSRFPVACARCSRSSTCRSSSGAAWLLITKIINTPGRCCGSSCHIPGLGGSNVFKAMMPYKVEHEGKWYYDGLMWLGLFVFWRGFQTDGDMVCVSAWSAPT